MNKLGLILGVLNTVAIAAVLGLFVYTKVIFKRPGITEDKQRKIIASTINDIPSDGKHFMVAMDQVTVNLDPYTGEDGKQKNHFATVTLTFELRNTKDEASFNAIKPIVMDRVIQNLSKKKFEDLNQVQGRYLFRSQIIDAANEYLGAPVVTEVYLYDFLIQ